MHYSPVGPCRPLTNVLPVDYLTPDVALCGAGTRPPWGEDARRLRHLHVLVVLQPDGGAEQALRQQLGSRGRAGEGGGGAQLRPAPRSAPLAISRLAGRDHAAAEAADALHDSLLMAGTAGREVRR